MSPAPDGILLVDKPAGVTSYDVVRHVKRSFHAAFPDLRSRGRGGPRFKFGHAGTLDPLATGLLVVLLGRGSRLSPFLMGMDKSYDAVVRFGAATDTLDREGSVTGTAPAPASPARVAELLSRFRGRIRQVPPLVSALKRDGKPLYKRVRDREDVPEPEAREVEISRLEIRGVHWGLPARIGGEAGEPGLLGPAGIVHEAELAVDCSSGTYIRSLARDLGEAAGSAAHLHALRRTRIGPFAVADAVSGAMALGGAELAALVLAPARALAHLPGLTLDADEATRVRNGGQPESAWLVRLEGALPAAGESRPLFRLMDGAGDLVAVGETDPTGGGPRLAAVFPAADGDGSQE